MIGEGPRTALASVRDFAVDRPGSMVAALLLGTMPSRHLPHLSSLRRTPSTSQASTCSMPTCRLDGSMVATRAFCSAPIPKAEIS